MKRAIITDYQIFGQFFDELSFEGLDFKNGFKCNAMHNFEKLNNSSFNVFEINYYQDQDRWKQFSIPIATNKMNQIEFLTY